MLNQFIQQTKPCIETGISLLDMLLPRHDNPIVSELLRDIRGGFLLFALIVCFVSLAILIDFVLGISKSLLAKRKISSFKMRDSFAKITFYYGAILLMFLFDLLIITHNIYDRPYTAMVAGIVVIATEIISWFESLDDKDRRKAQRSTSVIVAMLKGLGLKVDIAGALAKAIEESQEQTKPTGGQIKSGRASTPENSNATDSIDHPENHAPGDKGIRPKPNIHEMEEQPLL